jgi:DNA-binding beta-propeller fold protein YncE
VPEKISPQLSALPPMAPSMFEGGKGIAPGQFGHPRGIAADNRGNIFIADTENSRIQKFSATGAFVSSIGTKGAGYGQFGEPDGIAIDPAGNIYVAEAFNHRVQKLTPDGAYLAEWRGPDPGFYGPRKLTLGPDQSLYVVDQGRTRIVRLNLKGEVLATWGRKGTKDGEFDDPTSVTVDPTGNTVYVADPRNGRIQVFDSSGKFLRKWSVPEWGQPYGFEDLTIDPASGRLFASSARMDSILVFDLKGNRIGALRLNPPDKLEGAGSILFSHKKLYVLSTYGNRVIQITP